jgi:CBS domain-containing protein
MLVSQILKLKAESGVMTIAPDATVAKAVEMLASRRIGAVVVSPDGKTVVGILSERDVVRELFKRGAGVMADRVDSLMTGNPVSCKRDETADQILTKMTDGRFRHLPVVEGGEMVGLISIGDVVKARLVQLEGEKSALEGMIKGF